MSLPLVLALVVLGADKPKLAVLDVQVVGADAALGVGLGEAITQQLSQRAFFDVISSKDLRTLLGVERQKQLLGCGDSSCAAELTGALGARFVLQATLTKLGDALQLSLQTLDTAKAVPVARSVRLANDVKTLVQQLPWALAEATATPSPPVPSTALPWTLVGVGAAALLGAGIVSVDAFSREGAIAQKFSVGTGAFDNRATYASQLATVGTEKTAGLIGGLAGAALLVTGLLLFPPSTGGGVALVPTGPGIALVGVLP
jgi:TolB-like protein